MAAGPDAGRRRPRSARRMTMGRSVARAAAMTEGAASVPRTGSGSGVRRGEPDRRRENPGLAARRGSADQWVPPARVSEKSWRQCQHDEA